MAPSRRPRVAAKPPLVVAIAAQPTEAKSRADPSSHALGIEEGRAGHVQGAELLGFLPALPALLGTEGLIPARYRRGATVAVEF